MAFVIYNTNLATGKRSETITPARAKWILENLNNPSDSLTESQKAYQCNKRFVFNRSKERVGMPVEPSFVQCKIGAVQVLRGALAMASETAQL